MTDSIMEVELRLRDQISMALKGVNERIDELKSKSGGAARSTKEFGAEIAKATDVKRLMERQVKSLISGFIGAYGLVGSIQAVVSKLQGMRDAWIKVRDETLKTAPVFAAYNEQLKRSADLTRDIIAQRLKLQGMDKITDVAQVWAGSQVGTWERFQQVFGFGSTQEQDNERAFMAEMQRRARARVEQMGAEFATPGLSGGNFADRRIFTLTERGKEELAKLTQEEITLEEKRLGILRETFGEEAKRVQWLVDFNKRTLEYMNSYAPPTTLGGFQMGTSSIGGGGGDFSEFGLASDSRIVPPEEAEMARNVKIAFFKKTMATWWKGFQSVTGFGDKDPHADWRAEQEAKAKQRAQERFDNAQEIAKLQQHFDEVLADQDEEALRRRRDLNARLHDLNAEMLARGSFMGGGIQMSDGTVINSGVLGGFKDAVNEASDLGSQGYALGQGTFGSFVGSLSAAMTNFATKAKSASEAIREFAASFVASVVQMVNQILASQIAKAIFGGFINGGGTPTYTPGEGMPLWATPSALGNAWTDSGAKVTAFAKGGVVGGPTMFGTKDGLGVMGEAGAEAVMPLARTRGGALGVRTTGGAATTVVINAVDGASVEQMLWRNKDALWQLVALGMIQRNDYRAAMLGGV